LGKNNNYWLFTWIIHADAVRSARLKGKECRYRGKEVHGKRVECYAEGKINVNGRYYRK